MPTSPAQARRATRNANGLPPKQGLYDPWFEHDACGVGFVVDIKGRKSHKILQQAIQILKQPGPPRRRGLRGQHRRRRGRPDPDAARFPQGGAARRACITLPGPGEYGSGLIFLPRDRTKRRRLEERFEQIVQSEGQSHPRLADGSRSTTRRWARPPRRASRSSARCSSGATRSMTDRWRSSASST